MVFLDQFNGRRVIFYQKIFFGYFKDDGFVKRKNKGRIDAYGKWEIIKEKWIGAYINKEDIAGISVNRAVVPEDEWCAEAYMETDYSKLSRGDFELSIKEFVYFNELFNDQKL